MELALNFYQTKSENNISAAFNNADVCILSEYLGKKYEIFYNHLAPKLGFHIKLIYNNKKRSQEILSNCLFKSSISPRRSYSDLEVMF
jgi:hypothetical protein